MVRPVSLLLTLLTGFSGLVYEVAWQKYLATLLGSHSEATAAVLAIFLGGMALGYELFGRLAARVSARVAGTDVPGQLRTYGVVEGSIGLWALAFPWLFGAAQRVSFLVPPGHEALSFTFDVLLCVLLLGPPTVLMGGTIPLLTQALSRSVAESTRVHAWIYAVNTAGAFAGALAGGFVLVPWLGLDGVLRAMGAVNLGAGAIFVAQSRLGAVDSSGGEPSGPAVGANAARASVATYGWIAFLGGFAMMSFQTVANRICALSLGSSHFTFAMVAASFVACIALGSFAVAAMRTIPRSLIAASQWALVAAATALYFAIPLAPYGAHVLRSFFRDTPQAFWPFHLTVFLALFGTLALPVSFSGALLPLLFHHLRERHGDLGRIAGRLYSANTLGSLAGALLSGYVLLFWLDLADVYRVALAALAIGAALVTTNVLGAARRVSAAACAAAIACAALLPAWNPAELTAGAFRVRTPQPETYQGSHSFYAADARNMKLIFHRDDPVATITVLEVPFGEHATRSIVNNGKSDGNTKGDYATMCYAALLPALFADDVSNSFVIGWGTGISAGELTRLERTKRVRAAEISPGVIEAAPLFQPWNLGAHASPKVTLERRDAYRALLHTRDRYGVILSEPSNPWVTGVEMLFSREFLEAARSRLTPGGVYAQWMHGYETDAATVGLVLQTYASVFDHIGVWYTRASDVLLLGYNGPPPPLAQMQERFARPDFAAGFARCGAKRWEEFAAHELLPVGLIAPQANLPVHTLRRPLLSHMAARAFFVGRQAEFPALAGPISSPDPVPRGLLGGVAASLVEPDLRDLTQEVCASQRSAACATWHAYWEHRFPDSKLREDTWPNTRGGISGDPLAAKLLVQRLVALYRGETPTLPGANRVETARYASALYATHFVHAIPFPRRGIQRAWRGCEQGPGAIECLDARRAAERTFTSLDGGSAP